MILRKYRWSRHYESAEEELLDILRAKRIDAKRRHADEYEETEEKAYKPDTQFWCVEGSIIFIIGGKEITLQAGDVLDIPAHTPFKSKAGFSGAVCYTTS